MFTPCFLATDQKAGGSNPSRRAKNLEKSSDFSRFLQLFMVVSFCSFGVTQVLTHTGKLLDSTGEEIADRIGGLGLHGGGNVGVSVQGEACGVMTQHGGQGFHVHTVLEGQDREGMAQAVERDFLQPCPLQYLLELIQDAVRGDRASGG